MSDQADAWLKDSVALAQDMVEWFAATAGRTMVRPGVADCLPAVQELLVMKRGRHAVVATPNQEKLLGYWKKFARALDAERVALDDACADIIGEDPERERAALSIYVSLLDRIERQKQQTEKLLADLGIGKPIDRTRRVGDIALETWERASRGRGGVPRSKGPRDPLCRVVATMLEWLASRKIPKPSPRFSAAGGAGHRTFFA